MWILKEIHTVEIFSTEEHHSFLVVYVFRNVIQENNCTAF